MKKFNYLTILINENNNKLEIVGEESDYTNTNCTNKTVTSPKAYLRGLGEEGWELVGLFKDRFILKKEISTKKEYLKIEDQSIISNNEHREFFSEHTIDKINQLAKENWKVIHFHTDENYADHVLLERDVKL